MAWGHFGRGVAATRKTRSACAAAVRLISVAPAKLAKRAAKVIRTMAATVCRQFDLGQIIHGSHGLEAWERSMEDYVTIVTHFFVFLVFFFGEPVLKKWNCGDPFGSGGP